VKVTKQPKLDYLPDAVVLAEAVEVFKALGNPQRLSIIHALSHEELSVGQLARGLGISLTVASQHLSILRRLGLVASRDDGRLTFYRVVDDVVSHLVHDCLEHVGGTEPREPKRKGHRRVS
jgi:DNA-binding transcriptional ArsR family regulator